ncbi:hypothetical protein LAWI1_G004587 [Lachnellula willkommii]|uniref:Uncharacterized protein n=1 Tax=Lachnellula willkommii TaxID=215461 RepID=A0A559MEB9_9HELO|nr:hypothetical protein LAWI1_G004587 [Lachnellula willkommii]
MSKAKAAKGTVNVPNKILHSRVSYLYQAASYLAAQQPHSESGPTQYERDTSTTPSNHPKSIETNGAEHSSSTTFSEAAAYRPASRRMISDLRSVTLKGQMRISPAMKHSTCKKCDTLLVDGSTCTNEVENKSKEGRKPWADVWKSGNPKLSQAVQSLTAWFHRRSRRPHCWPLMEEETLQKHRERSSWNHLREGFPASASNSITLINFTKTHDIP